MDILGFVSAHKSSSALDRLYAKVCKGYLNTIKFLGEKSQTHEFPWLLLHSNGINSKIHGNCIWANMYLNV